MKTELTKVFFPSHESKVTVNAECVCWEKVLGAFKVIRPVEAQYINELTLPKDQW